MRPVELRLRNFRSYFGDEASFDFRDRRLVGIVGPIGSGKSTILDAIAFALYGRTPSVGRSTKALIHQRADNATVAFRFSVDGELWEAQRMLRAKGASQHALYRLAGDGEGVEKLEQITGEVEVTAKVAELLGLDFDAFGRSVLLAQNRFAEFLTARPAERDKVLKGVFGHDRIDRMRAVAKERARDAEIEAEKATVAVQHLAEVEAALATRRDALAAAEQQRRALADVAPRAEALGAAIASAVAEKEAADKTLEELRSVAKMLPDEEQVAAVVSASQGARDRRTAAADALAEARALLQAAEERAAAASDVRETLAAADALIAGREVRLGAVRDAEEALKRGSERYEQAVAEAAGQGDRVKLAEREASQAADRLKAAEAAYHDHLHVDMAATLRADLHEGDPCPVCRQTVAAGPPTTESGTGEALGAARVERRDAEAANTKANGASEAAKTAASDAARRKQEAADAVAELESRLDEARRGVEAATTELVAVVGSDEVDEALMGMRQEVAEAAAQLEANVTARDRARDDHDAAIEDEQGAGRRLSDLRIALSGIATKVEPDLAPGDAPSDVAEAAEALRAAIEQSERDAAKRGEQASSLADEHRAALSTLAEEVGVSGSFDEALGAVRSRVELLADEITRGEQQLTQMGEATERRDVQLAAMKTYQTLAGDLTDARFVRYLLDAERRRLAELGSEDFQRLTNGRYRFTDDGAFDIVDLTAADAVRKADSLSGGETFLASLGLALALAEIVSRGGGRLDSFFLDEGFGTLDPEHLDLAMEGIESLVDEAGTRLVVVVSHVPELRHRIEDLIELDRSPTTGDTRVVSA